MSPNQSNQQSVVDPRTGGRDHQFLFFSELLNRRVCAGKIKDKIGKLTDIVFRLSEQYPEAIGLYLEHGWGKPSEFIPWDAVVRLDEDAIFVKPPSGGGTFPPFVDQAGWILLNEHLMGKTILDMDGRRTEVVNDVHLLEVKGRLIIVHVDVSFNGFLRKWGLGRFHLVRDQFISWRYVQPLSVEDVSADSVSLSITRRMMKDLPSEDLADVLEELKGSELHALFSALDHETAADALIESEPRAQRRIIASLRSERARMILSEMSVLQLADLFSVLPRDHMMELMSLLPPDTADRITAILAEREGAARSLVSADYVTARAGDRAGDILSRIRTSELKHEMISYVYVVGEPGDALVGVVDLRELVLAHDEATIGQIMTAPVVSAEADDTRDDLAELFAKYHYRMLPVVDRDRLLGVVHYNDIMKGLVTRPRA